jgi:hypothetical protein
MIYVFFVGKLSCWRIVLSADCRFYIVGRLSVGGLSVGGLSIECYCVGGLSVGGLSDNHFFCLFDAY